MLSRLRPFAAFLLLAALLLRAAIPAGFMPDMGDGHSNKGGFITICTMDGAKQIEVSGKFLPQSKDSDGHKKSSVCPYALNASPMKAEFAFATVVHVEWQQIQAMVQPVFYVTAKPYLNDAAPRGPPVFLS